MDHAPLRHTRRDVLRAGVVVASAATAAAVVAACGSTAAAPDDAATSPAGEPTGAQSSGSTEPTAPSDRLILGPASAVPVGGGVIYSVERVVVTQPEEGTFLAYDVVCPHQGCAVSSVDAEGILCPCHGSVFDVRSGQPLRGPADSGLEPRSVSLDGPDLVLG